MGMANLAGRLGNWQACIIQRIPMFIRTHLGLTEIKGDWHIFLAA
jgi:hypothetical protein